MRYLVSLFLYIIALGPTLGQQNSAIYIHTDRDFYFPGDTVWFKSYIMENGFLSKNTINLYLRLADQDSREFQQSVALVSNGITASHLQIPLDYQGQELFLNAYTQDANCPDQSPYFKKIGILQFGANAKSLSSTEQKNVELNANIILRPEGGVLLSNLENELSIQSHNGQGYPLVAKGKLIDQNSGDHYPFETDSAGFARIRFTPDASHTYVIEWIGEDGIERKDNVPQASEGAKVMIQTDDIQTIIQLISNSPSQMVKVEATLGQRQLFKQELQLTSGKKVNIPLQNVDLEYGILQIKLTDNTDKLLSKRSHLVGQQHILVEPEVILEKGEGEKTANQLQIRLPNIDETANLSVSITDIDVPIDSMENILTDLMLKPIATKSLLQPFTFWQKSKDRALYIQSLTWKNFDCPMSHEIQKDTLFTLRGQIKMVKNRWPKFYKEYQEVIQNEAKNNRNIRGASFGYQDFTSPKMKYKEVNFDSLGRFSIPDLILIDSVDTKFVQIYRKLKFEPFYIHYTFASPHHFKHPFYIPAAYSSFVQPATWRTKKWGINTGFTIDAAGNRVLQTAIVNRSRRQREIDRMEKRFHIASLPTNLEPDQVLLPLLDSNVIKRSQSLADYLQQHIRVVKYVVFLNGQPVHSLSGKRPLGMRPDEPNYDDAFLNEDVSNFPYIKFYSAFPLADNAPTVVIFQYAPDEVDREIGKSVDEQTLIGYMPVNQFHNKTYLKESDAQTTGYDDRATLYWNPFVTTPIGRPSDPLIFFNNSKANGYCVTIQGVSRTGKLIYYRKIFK